MLFDFKKLNTEDENDLKFTYRILKSRIRSSVIDREGNFKLPTYDEHVSYLKSNPYVDISLVIFDGTHQIGMIYFNKKDEFGLYFDRGSLRLVKGSAVGVEVSSKYIKHINPDQFFFRAFNKNTLAVKMWDGIAQDEWIKENYNRDSRSVENDYLFEKYTRK